MSREPRGQLRAQAWATLFVVMYISAATGRVGFCSAAHCKRFASVSCVRAFGSLSGHLPQWAAPIVSLTHRPSFRTGGGMACSGARAVHHLAPPEERAVRAIERFGAVRAAIRVRVVQIIHRSPVRHPHRLAVREEELGWLVTLRVDNASAVLRHWGGLDGRDAQLGRIWRLVSKLILHPVADPHARPVLVLV